MPGVSVPTTPQTGNRSKEEILDALQQARKEFGELSPERRSAEPDAALQSLYNTVRSLDSELTVAMLIEDVETRAAGRPAVHPQDALLAATMGPGALATRSGHSNGGRALIDAPAVKDWIEHGCKAEGFEVSIPMGIDGFQTRAEFEWAPTGPGTYVAPGAMAADSDATLLPVGQPIPPVPRRAKLYLRDLIPKMSTTLARIPYVRELTPTANESASAVGEGTLKPATNLNFQGASADPTVIAATLTISKQLFEDAPLVVQYVNQRLPYITKFKEDNEFLNGSGTWPDLLGIFNQPGLQTQAFINTDSAQTVGQAFADIEMADGEVTATVWNPVDAWTMFTKRAAGGSGTFDAGTPFSALPLTVWGVPTYRTRAKASGTVLVGDFTRGATIVDREQVNVQTYRERYAELNEILLICEERVGLMVQRPDLFVDAHLS